MKSNFQELKSHYTDYKQIYTDKSKDDMKVGCAVVSDNFSETMQIPDGSNFYNRSKFDLVLNRIADYETSNKFVIFFFLLPLDHTSSKNSPNSKST